MVSNILFHHFKHHLGYIKTWLGDNQGNLSPANIIAIKTLGSSQLDMYCGPLGVNDILQQISAYLQAKDINDIIAFKQWIDNGFKLCTLSDGSCFTIRFINHVQFVAYSPGKARTAYGAYKSQRAQIGGLLSAFLNM